ncbi:MAG: hypothetical protein LBV33_07445 [Lachnospiraceae bacterium]|jgi:hypothetical protein|nr:hypothetical protein [Lachnospiraceae bacterium]
MNTGQALASYANAIFLGGLGIFATAVSGQVVFGYMIPILYYVLDLMGGSGSFTLFSLLRKGTMEGKWVLLMIGIVWIALSLAWHNKKPSHIR